MKVLLLGNYEYDRQESMQRFLAALLDGLTAAGVSCDTLAPAPFFGRLRPGSSGLGKWLGYLDKFLLFPFRLRATIRRLKRAGNFIVHICDHSNAHYTRYLNDVPSLVTCHDVLAIRSARGDFPENRTSATGRIYQNLIARGLRHARHIACISEATRAQLLAIVPYPPEQTTLVRLGLNYPYRQMPPVEAAAVVRALRPGDTPFLFHVGGNQWYKNRAGLLGIFAAVKARHARPLQLIVAGKPLPDELRQSVPPEWKADLIEVGNVDNEQLRALYSAAAALVFPSKYEGFGWPLIEAQACGCPVATSDRAPMNAIVGEAGVTFDPDESAQAADAVLRLLNESAAARENRVALGLANAAGYSTARMLDAYRALYARLT